MEIQFQSLAVANNAGCAPIDGFPIVKPDTIKFFGLLGPGVH